MVCSPLAHARSGVCPQCLAKINGWCWATYPIAIGVGLPCGTAVRIMRCTGLLQMQGQS